MLKQSLALLLALAAALSAQDRQPENHLRNHSFEEPDLQEFYIRQVARDPQTKEVVPHAPGDLIARRDSSRAHLGNYALALECRLDHATNEVNLNALPYLGQSSYRFQAYYYLAETQPGARVAGRITFFDAEKKVIRHMFPEFPVRKGEWLEIQQNFFPPVGTARITVTLWFSGRMRAWVDDVSFGLYQDQELPERFQAAQILQESPSFSFWKEAPYFKVQPQDCPAGLQHRSLIELSAAANEREPFQLVVTPKQEISALSLRFSPLQAPGGESIPASALSYRIVGFINLKQPDNPKMAGLHADPLLPEQQADAKVGQNLPFYVMIDVPAGQKPGIYEGKLELLSGQVVQAEAGLRLKVWDFALPADPTLKTYFYTRLFKAYTDLDRRPHEVIVDDIMGTLQQHRMTGNQALWPAHPKVEIKDGELSVDWSSFDANISDWIERFGMRHFGVPHLGMMGDNSGWFGKNRSSSDRLTFDRTPLFSDLGLRYVCRYAQLFTEHVKEKFPDTDFYAYIYDEPPAKVYAELSRLSNALHQAAPDLKIFIPKNVNDEIGYVHTWCVPFSPGHVKPDLQAREVAAGKEIWYYNWTVSLADHNYLNSRLYSWKIYNHDGIGGLLWNTIFMPEGINPWTDLDKTFACGGATIFYPPRNAQEGIIPSLRSAQIREAIDDYDYLKILEQRLEARFPGHGRRRVKELLRAIFPDGQFEVVNNPHLLYALRQRLAEEIEQAGRDPRQLVLCLPPENSRTEVSEVSLQIYGDPGTTVAIDGRAALPIPPAGLLEVTHQLSHFGLNRLAIVCRNEQTSTEIYRNFTLLPDPNLEKLRALSEKLRAAGRDEQSILAFLEKVRTNPGYSRADRETAANLLAEGKHQLVAAEMEQAGQSDSPLAAAFLDNARWAFQEQLFERSEYYLALSRSAAAAGKMDGWAVSLKPVDFQGHFALQLQNSRLTATIMETGGRIISLKNGEVECLSPGSFAAGLTRLERARQKTDPSMVTRLKGYNGFEDAGGGNLWPVSFVDWNLSFRELSDRRIVLAAETMLPDSPFHIRRIMSLEADSPDLVLEYEFTNTTPKDLASDDPAHFQLTWRGRLVPAIGEGAQALLHDQLVIPTAKALPATLFELDQPVYYEERQVKLTGRVMGAFDTVSGKGLALILDPQLTHAYIWFNSDPKAGYGQPIYTLEVPRSFYGKQHDDPEANAPFTIPAGTSLNMRLIFRVLENITPSTAWPTAP
ncbi:MAG: DUF4091 domain-containing protein [Oligosphaeraceae bacterium]|nr:DUF4091 domain-containing protein [Oligosphaeraceae bacterium]